MYEIEVNPGCFHVFQCCVLAGDLKRTGIEHFNLICTIHSFCYGRVQLSDNRFSGHENHSVILVFPVIFIRLAGQKDKA